MTLIAALAAAALVAAATAAPIVRARVPLADAVRELDGLRKDVRGKTAHPQTGAESGSGS